MALGGEVVDVDGVFAAHAGGAPDKKHVGRVVQTRSAREAGRQGAEALRVVVRRDLSGIVDGGARHICAEAMDDKVAAAMSDGGGGGDLTVKLRRAAI